MGAPRAESLGVGVRFLGRRAVGAGVLAVPPDAAVTREIGAVAFHLRLELLPGSSSGVHPLGFVPPNGQDLLERAQIVTAKGIGPLARLVGADTEQLESAPADDDGGLERFALDD